MNDFKKTGPYSLKPGILTAVHPSGIFLKLVEIDEDGYPQVDVYVHPDSKPRYDEIYHDGVKWLDSLK